LEITQLSPEEQATMNENALLDVGEAFVGGDRLCEKSFTQTGVKQPKVE